MIQVIEPGLQTLVVDYGRWNHGSLGVPRGGAADRASLALGNALVGNAPDTPGLEMCLAGPTLRTTCPLACVIFGAPFSAKCGRKDLIMGKTFTWEAGDDLRVEGTREGMRAYLCIRGGIKTHRILGSYSSLKALAAGDELPVTPGHTASRYFRDVSPLGSERFRLRVVDGAQADWSSADKFYHQRYLVSQSVNRMGMRLQGGTLTTPDKELVSEAVSPGAVQVTREGQCILLGVDGQTIGGYPKIAHVISADLDHLGQLRPGDYLSFERVKQQEAEDLFRVKEAERAGWILRLRTAEAVRSVVPDHGLP